MLEEENPTIERFEDEGDDPVDMNDSPPPPAELPPPSAFNTNQYDPFAPSPERAQTPSVIGTDEDQSVWSNPAPPPLASSYSGEEERFHDEEDEEEDVIMVPAGSSASLEKLVMKKGKRSASLSSSPSIKEDPPVLISNHPDADADLLGGVTSVVPKKAKKSTKDRKFREITYRDGDEKGEDLINAENSPLKKKKKKTREDDEDDKFVDDDGAGKNEGGFFSRFRNKAPVKTSTPAIAPEDPPLLKANGLDEGGNSPNGLEEGGNSLPHPATLLKGSTRDAISEDEDDSSTEGDALDSNGNSLPHPEDMKTHTRNSEAPLNDTVTPFLDLDNTQNSGSGSDHESDHARLVAALKSEAGSDEEEGFDEEYASGEEGEYALNDMDDEENGKDENGNKIPSLRWGGLRMSLRSTYKKAKEKDESERSDSDHFDEDNFRDEEQVRSAASNQKEGADGIHKNEDADLLDLNRNQENGNSLPEPDKYVSYSNPLAAKLASIKNNLVSKVASSKKPKKMASEQGAENDEDLFLPAEGDVENPRHVMEVDNFDDESQDDATTKKPKKSKSADIVAAMRKNWMLILIIVVALAIFLGMLIPLIQLSNYKRTQEAKNKLEAEQAKLSTIAPTLAETPEPCQDEVVLVDRWGKDLVADDFNGSPPCYTTDQAIVFRFKRCQPAAPTDWVGLFPAGSLFMDKLWKPYVDGVYLCGDQPCPTEGFMLTEAEGMDQDMEPIAKVMVSPPIYRPGTYQFFMVKDSNWPYEYINSTLSFRVVRNANVCGKSGFDAPSVNVTSDHMIVDDGNVTSNIFDNIFDMIGDNWDEDSNTTFPPTASDSNSGSYTGSSYTSGQMTGGNFFIV